MRWSKGLIRTLREAPREAETVSHKLMFRAGLVRRLAAGLYTYLPLGLRVLRKVERIVREEMERQGALELLMPTLQPRELWEISGRWNDKELGMLKLKNREEREFALGPTHEEIVTDLVSKEVRSYKELPLNLYQIQTKFRDELRPRFGLIRAREFMMKDAYSFDVDEESSRKSYRKMYEAYVNIFRRCGIKARVVEADPGAMGGGKSEEFIALADSGEDTIISCSQCNYAANVESAQRGEDEKKDDNRHVENVNGGRDYNPDEAADISQAREGDRCSKCHQGRLTVRKGIEIGHIFNLGKRYSLAMKAKFLDEDGKEKPLVMGCYGIGISRTVAAIIEQNHDEEGIIWPREVSPYQLHILSLNVRDQKTVDWSNRLYKELKGEGVEVLFDDRDERAGIKFKDADLLGIPLHLTVSPRRVSEGKVELKCRREGKEFVVGVGEVLSKVRELITIKSESS